MAKETTIERDWLYKEVWKRASTKIANDLGISSSALKRICKSMDIPTPQPGYWAKIQAGRKIAVPKLPQAIKETKTIWTINSANSEVQKQRIEKDAETKEKLEALPTVELSTDLENLHSLVKATRTHLRELSGKVSWDKRKNRRRLNATVSEGTLDRASLFLDILVKAIESMGFKFRCDLDSEKGSHLPDRFRHQQTYDDHKSGICWIEAGGERVTLVLKEKNRRSYKPPSEKWPWKTFEDIPSGILECRVGDCYSYNGRTSWKDGSSQKIEDQIPLIIATVPQIADAMRLAKEARAREEERYRRAEELRRFVEYRKRLDREAIEEFLGDATTFRSACLAREYMNAMKARFASKIDSEEPEENLKIWIEWIERKISQIDPLEGSPPWEKDSFKRVIENLKLEPPTWDHNP
ncbi:hypothetical protein OVA24_17615 [Luteolibacter sp. SL250]|uniref:hypothetical protein n=1 Tax=Luteolibacter sp. SL250 TaxID=2995170 RepID=UPI00226DF749|nr:hypothetical protein [Luteolibacter sp. SL250]WAC19048.1 hypothetical protein OVA24_17615 [Luteolibacter sp. SL250]